MKSTQNIYDVSIVSVNSEIREVFNEQQWGSSSLEPWSWGEVKAKLWLVQNGLSEFIEPLSSKFCLNGASLMELREENLSFLTTQENYPKLIGRLSALHHLYQNKSAACFRRHKGRASTENTSISLFPQLERLSVSFVSKPPINTNQNNEQSVDYTGMIICTDDCYQSQQRDSIDSLVTNQPSTIDQLTRIDGSVCLPSDMGQLPCNVSKSNFTDLLHTDQHSSNSFRRQRLIGDSDRNDCPSAYFHASTSKFAIQRFLLALCICVFGCTFCAYMVVLADERRPPRDLYPPLPDVFLDNVKRVTWATPASEVIIVVINILFFALALIRIDRLIILKRCALMIGSVYTLRGVTIYCTSLTVVGDHLQCYPQSINFTSIYGRLQRLMVALSSQGLQINGAQACGDYIFSGHTCILVMLTHFITYYLPRRFWMVIASLWLVTGFAIVCILAAHFHYTVDVVLAAAISSYLFTYYHALCNCPSMFEPHIKARLFIYLPMFYLFENQESCSVINCSSGERRHLHWTDPDNVTFYNRTAVVDGIADSPSPSSYQRQSVNVDQDLLLMTDFKRCLSCMWPSNGSWKMPRVLARTCRRVCQAISRTNGKKNGVDLAPGEALNFHDHTSIMADDPVRFDDANETVFSGGNDLLEVVVIDDTNSLSLTAEASCKKLARNPL